MDHQTQIEAQQPIPAPSHPSVTPARRFIAIGLILVSAIAVFLGPALSVLQWLQQGEAPAVPALNEAALWLSMAYNWVAMVLLPAAAVVILGGLSWTLLRDRLQLGLGEKWRLWIPLGFLAGALSVVVLGLLVTLLDRIGWYQVEESAFVPLFDELLTWPLAILLAVTAGITEEIYFRAFLQRRLGIVASGLLFGLVHASYGTVLQLVAPALLGILFGFLVRWSASIWPAVAAHFAFNMIQLGLLILEE